MTDEERKQFINEYCRNVGNIKIKCDDCKFVEDCVDYGWQECKKFTPKPSEPMTNEKWLHTLNTEQLADWLVEVTQYCYECGTDVHNCECCPFGKCIDKGFAMEWLKQPHKE